MPHNKYIICVGYFSMTSIYYKFTYLKDKWLGDKRFELLKAIAIEFTAQPFLPIKEPSLMYNIKIIHNL